MQINLYDIFIFAWDWKDKFVLTEKPTAGVVIMFMYNEFRLSIYITFSIPFEKFLNKRN